MLDLKFLNLAQHNVAAFARKADAVAFAKRNGKWRPSDVFRAYNRFCIFWVVGDASTDLRVLNKDGNTVTIKFPVRD
jgi:hypothetical protein